MIARIFTLLGVFLILLGVSFSSVEQFTQYDTTLTLYDNNTLKVQKSAYLRNIHVVGIVPGQVEFKISHESNNINLLNMKVTDRYGAEIKNKIIETPYETIIILEIFTPVLPGFQYPIFLEYTLSYETGGLFFNSLKIPFKEDTGIPIVEGTYTLNIPDGNYFTYLSFYDNYTIVNQTQAIWNINKNSPESLEVEYSFIPLTYKSFIRGSILFWMSINILLIIILLNEVRREIKKLNSNKLKKK